MEAILHFSKQNKQTILILALLLLATLYFGFILDIGLNSKYFVKRDFNKAFLARKTGDCDTFITYIINDIDSWRQRCINEKDRAPRSFVGRHTPISNFEIVDITTKKNTAFVQAELTRDEDPYHVNYDMERTTERILGILPATRYKIRNEIR